MIDVLNRLTAIAVYATGSATLNAVIGQL